MTRTVQCIKLGKEAQGLDMAPVPGELGEKILQGVSKEAWTSWLAHQTMLINENRLSLRDPASRKFLQEELDKYFFGGGSEVPAGFVPKS
jgi:Fe-S cluster biosynthesis and repair protein YggX